MSVCILVPVLLPAAAAAWPIIAAAAGAAALTGGFSAIEEEEVVENAIELDVAQAVGVADDLTLGAAIQFKRDGVTITLQRTVQGRISLRVQGDLEETQLQRIGEEMHQSILQNYAYHQIVTQLKDRDFQMVEELREEDGTVRIRVRNFI